ncbi:MAG: RNA methyltransferase [Ardenticatenales bacterium]|nr:RNA methyltransferase [Ardenticatenales bacterium]
MITSPSNSRVKMVRRLLAERRTREREQAYVIEGSRWLAELPAFNLTPHFLLYTNQWHHTAAHQALLARLAAPAYEIDARLLAEISGTETPAGILAVIPIKTKPLPDNPTLLLILDRLGDPGNLGTILRTAAAAGVEGILLSPGCVDAYNPKVVRGSMGAHLRLPIHALTWAEIGARVRGLAVYLADAQGTVSYDQANWRRPCALIIGSEAEGAGTEAMQLATTRVYIPMHAATESLNAAVSAGILLFEAARQRR